MAFEQFTHWVVLVVFTPNPPAQVVHVVLEEHYKHRFIMLEHRSQVVEVLKEAPSKHVRQEVSLQVSQYP